MNEQTQHEIEISAVLNTIPYMDQKFDAPPLPVNEVLCQKNALVQQPNLALTEGLVLVHQSSTNDTDAWTDDLIQACTFQDADGNYYVSFRGTGDGRWPDNADGMLEYQSLMQESAKKYFDAMAKEIFEKAHAEGKRVIVTGHSKGGNEAQYVFMNSKYEYLIDNCYSFDGQGFSDKAAKGFREQYGASYEEKCSKMYSICGENDYVHDLGRVIIPEENTYFVPTSRSGLAGWHALEYMICDGSKNYTGLKWAVKDGKITNGQQGNIGKLMRRISSTMMDMDEDSLRSSSLVIMYMVDWIFKGKHLGDVPVNPLHFLILLSDGLPQLLQGLASDEEARTLLLQIVRDGMKQLNDAYGPGAVVGAYMVIGLIILGVTNVAVPMVMGAQFLTGVLRIIQKLSDFPDAVLDCLLEIHSMVMEEILCIFSTLQQFLPGIDAFLSDDVKIDTDAMLLYADQLQEINRRLSDLDKSMDRLYLKVGLQDLYDLLQADILTDQSSRLNSCAKYLERTANDFKETEKKLLRAL